MNLIIDGLPETVEVGDREVPIETDFRVGMLIELALEDDEMTDDQRAATILELYFPGEEFTPEEAEDAMSAVLWFFRCGQTPTGGGSGEAGPPVYSYEYDAEMIYAAFYQAYRIDLSTARLHWWQFHALFRSLPESCVLTRAIGYRAMEIPADASAKERERLQRMKDLYALPKSEKQQRMETDLSALLMEGGNPLEILNTEAPDGSRRHP